MKKLIAVSIFCFLGGTMVYGQQEITKKCGTDEAMEVAFKMYPELRASYEAHQLLENSKQYSGKGMEKSVNYVIPVVFHILHEYGTENLDDSQIYDAMKVINEEFNAADPDSVNIRPEYANLIGDGRIEFKLASKDPFGNCTNGINHIYSHETRAGDNFSKINQWDRGHYLNIWVAIVIGSPGAAAYSQMPTATDGFGYWYDGVISNHTYVGSIGTSNVGKEHVLTHEIGHYLNLAHVWGGTNDPGVACGDDGVEDTPVTEGHNVCPAYPAGWIDCGQLALAAPADAYTFDNITPTSGTADTTTIPDPELSTADPSGITFSNFTAVGVGANPTTSGTFGFAGWDTGALDGETVYTNLTGSINTAKYYEFTVVADDRNRMTLDSLIFDVGRDATGPRTYSVRWNQDGYANNLALNTASSTNPDITVDSTNHVFFYNQDSTNLESGTSVGLAMTEFLPAIPVTFRIYSWNAENGAGDFIVDNVFIKGGYVAVEDIHNYMEYTYCNYHFTPGQIERMHNALEGIAGQRNILWQDSTLTLTGVDNIILPQIPTNDLANLTVPLCAPVADFSADNINVCVGQTVAFSDASWNAVVGSRSWTFQDATPATSTSTNPVVTFDTPGFKTVTLSATNEAGTGVETRSGYIYVSPLWADFSGPASNNLESSTANWFLVNNPEDNYAKFQLSNGTGYDNSRSYKLNNFKDVSGADLFNDDYFYNDRLGLSIDELITPSYDLRYTSNVTVSFKFSYATNATQIDQIEETLKVYTSVDCGENWLPRNINLEGSPVGNSLDGSEIVTGGFAGYTDYEPTSNNDWKTADFTYTPSALSDHVRFKFVFEASDVSSNLYIDDINVNGTLSIISDEIALLDLTVFPNPTTNGTAINVSYTAQDEPVTFTLRDTQGKIISTEVIEATNTLVNHTLKNSENLGAACYFVEVKSGDHVTTKKVVVL